MRDFREVRGQRGGELAYHVRPLATQTTLSALATFDEDMQAVGQATEDDPVAVGERVLIPTSPVSNHLRNGNRVCEPFYPDLGAYWE